MKYLCKTKEDDCYGAGKTIEEALDDFQGDSRDLVTELEWYELKPIKVKLVIDNSPVVKKTATKKGTTK